MIIAAMLSLFGGRAMAQRCLPGMSAVEIKANMADGFYTGKSRDCGYDLGVFYSVFTGSHGNTWSFGGEYLQTFKPYGENGRIPVVQFTGEAGYNLHILSDYSMTFHLYGGISALAGYETVNWGKKTGFRRPRLPASAAAGAVAAVILASCVPCQLLHLLYCI